MKFTQFLYRIYQNNSSEEPQLAQMMPNCGKDKVYQRCLRESLAQMDKNPPAMQETWIQSLGWEDPVEKGIATHSSILAWRIPKGRGVWQVTVHGVAKSQTRLRDEAQYRELQRHQLIKDSERLRFIILMLP